MMISVTRTFTGTVNLLDRGRDGGRLGRRACSYAEAVTPVIVLQGSGMWTQLAQPGLGLSDADGIRAPQFQHTVQDMDGNVDLGRPMLVRA